MFAAFILGRRLLSCNKDSVHDWPDSPRTKKSMSLIRQAPLESFFGDLRMQGREGVQFFTQQKVTMTRWFSFGEGDVWQR